MAGPHDRSCRTQSIEATDGHAVMGRMYKPGDEKRSVVILRPADDDEWLHTTNVDAVRSMLQLDPADNMVTEPK
ncbi:hypothetical protein [Burkholderia vietnamiensis]|uniref:hypothetical protein n=1 Tax=Burkholderia vietnamiensis TaxID=60552 RepID=UPI0039B63B79